MTAFEVRNSCLGKIEIAASNNADSYISLLPCEITSF